jgi:hypothetical protein
MNIRKIIKEEIDGLDWVGDIEPVSSAGLNWKVAYQEYDSHDKTSSLQFKISKALGEKIKNELVNWYHHEHKIKEVRGNITSWGIVFPRYSVDLDILLSDYLIHYNGTFIGLYHNPQNYMSVDDLDEEESLIEYTSTSRNQDMERPKRNFNPKIITDFLHQY